MRQSAQVEASRDHGPQDVPVPPGAGPLPLQYHLVVEAVRYSIGLDASLAHLVVHTYSQGRPAQLHTLLHQDTIADLNPGHTHTHTGHAHTHRLSNYILFCNINLTYLIPSPMILPTHLIPSPTHLTQSTTSSPVLLT